MHLKIAAISPAILAKSVGLWYNISMCKNQDINITNENIKADGLKSPAASHDNAWKEIINEKYLSPFLEFYFPEFHQDIDFSKGVKFLNTELPQLELMTRSVISARMCLWKCI
jgi:hypothetical protein